MTTLALLAVLAQAEGALPRYPATAGAKERIFSELQLGIKIEGSDTLAGYVRSMHPFLSMEKLVIRAEGARTVPSKNRQKFEYDEARVECRYDDEDHEFDYAKGQPPEGDKDKLRQMMWFLAAGGRNFTLTPEGDYRSDDANQDHNGEAMDLIALGIVRMPDKPVKAGDTYEKSWKGTRSEKGKKGVFAFTQTVTVAKVEGSQVTLEAALKGVLTGQPKDPGAEEAKTTCEGTSTCVVETGTGRVISSSGAGKVVAFHRGTAENGQKQELTLTFGVSGKVTLK